MALSSTIEQEKVDNFTFSYQEVYRRIVKFYKQYWADWQSMSSVEKSICLSNGGCDFSLSTAFINDLADESDDLFYVLEIVGLVRSSKRNDRLESGFHMKDEHGIKLGMYAEYLLKQFEIISLSKYVWLT
ncbi:MAG: hypothetical protein WCK78_06600 [Paludibacter sp.]